MANGQKPVAKQKKQQMVCFPRQAAVVKAQADPGARTDKSKQ
jgi:hypothetical protein